MISNENTLKIADFGSAKEDLTHTTTIATGNFVGTVFYKAPECLFLKQKDNNKTEVWSIGLVLFQMVNGMRTKPFRKKIDDYNYDSFTEELNEEGPNFTKQDLSFPVK